MLLYNGFVFQDIFSLIFSFFSDSYPPIYIYTRFKKFLPANYHQHRAASRIAKTIGPLKNDTIDNPSVRMRPNKLLNSDRNLIIHYIHEA
jgi:hypothetical protein